MADGVDSGLIECDECGLLGSQAFINRFHNSECPILCERVSSADFPDMKFDAQKQLCLNHKPCSVHPETAKETPDPINHPPHYTSHPSGIECITVVEHMGFNLGNAIKYIWRADLKGADIQDLEKAAWYVNRELERRRKVKP